MVRDADSRCPRGHRPSQNTSTKVQTQGSTAKESKPEESRPKELKLANEKTPAPPRTNEPRKTSRQDKKKEYLKKKRDRKNSIPAIENNAIKDEKKRNDWGDRKCYNFQKKEYFARNCLEPPKNKCQPWQLPCRWLVVIRRTLSGCFASTIWSDSSRNR